MAVKAQLISYWGMRPLGAIQSFADRTIDPNCFQLFVFSGIKLVSIDNITSMMQFTTQSDGKLRRGLGRNG
jgi:hypothetical protein